MTASVDDTRDLVASRCGDTPQTQVCTGFTRFTTPAVHARPRVVHTPNTPGNPCSTGCPPLRTGSRRVVLCQRCSMSPPARTLVGMSNPTPAQRIRVATALVSSRLLAQAKAGARDVTVRVADLLLLQRALDGWDLDELAIAEAANPPPNVIDPDVEDKDAPPAA